MKKILITGATDGIGLETAILAANKGFDLLLHGRSEDKLEKAVAAVKSANPSITVHQYLADLSKFADIEDLTQKIENEHKNIDVIINNAGIFKTSTPLTEDGLDVRFVVNTFAPIMISKALLPLLNKDGRIVNLSSAAQAPINMLAITGEQPINEAFQAYAQSKLALTIWTQEFAKMLEAGQICVAVNPGSMLASKMVKEGFGVAGNDLSIGAQILLNASIDASFIGASGKYFDNDSQQFAQPHTFALKQSNRDDVVRVLYSTIEKYTS